MQTYQEMRERIESLAGQNDRLTAALRTARGQLVDLRADLARVAEPPNTYAVFLGPAEDDLVDVLVNNRKMRVGVGPEVAAEELSRGQEVLLSENLALVLAKPYARTGQVVQVIDTTEDDRVIVRLHTDDERLLERSARLVGEPIRPGDLVLVDPRSGLVLESVERSEIADLVLETVPDITYEDIGGLGPQLDAIRDAVELPFLHQELFREHGLRPPKGVLLYGPPGCGKTMIAKAVANGLARQGAERTGADPRQGHFLNIKGPELLNKFVGETERSIRLVFERAREKAADGRPVVVFFDEMESLFRTRGSGVSSDVENTIVPQLLAEIDGVERLDNVMVIGASNREDMIDPAILRPGRLDVKIRIDRPGRAAAREILDLYLDESVPLADGVSRDALVEEALDVLYTADSSTGFLELVYDDGSRDTLFYRDFVSGAAIHNIVDRAKKSAIKDLLRHGRRGITVEHLRDSIADEFSENEDMPNLARPDEWARTVGRRGSRVRTVRVIPPEERS